MDGFSDSAAIVTGAAKGIGRATAERLASEGASVVVADVDEAAGQSVVEEIEADGGEAAFANVDVTDSADVSAMVSETVETYGGLDVAVNNAGIISRMVPTEDLEEADWDRIVDINLTGVWNCMRNELPAMTADGGGAIVNLASVAGLTGMPTLSSYSATKHGVVGLTKSAALEYAEEGVRVNAVAPGPTKTSIKPQGDDDRGEWLMSILPDEAAQGKGVSGRVLNWLSGGTIDRMARTPMGRIAQPAEIAGTIAFMASADASFVTGQVLAADGGQTAD